MADKDDEVFEIQRSNRRVGDPAAAHDPMRKPPEAAAPRKPRPALSSAEDFEIVDGQLGRITAEVPVIARPSMEPPAKAVAAAVAPAAPPPLSPGEGPRVGNYQLAGRIRSSPQSMVFLAHRVSDFGIARPVVLKIAPRNNANYDKTRERLVDEYRAMAMLDHPNICAVVEAADIEIGFYVALEYVDGPDTRRLLDKLAKAQRKLPIEVAVNIVVELLRGLEHAHTASGADDQPLGIVHRNVNPSNVLLSRYGQVKLSDFGVVKMRGRAAADTEPGLIKGNFAYLPPEYIRGEHLDHRIDLYAAGVLLFELVTGGRCFRAEGTDLFKDVLAGLDVSRLADANVPDQLTTIIARAANKDASQRYRTATEMGFALEDWLSTNRYYVSPSSIAAVLRTL